MTDTTSKLLDAYFREVSAGALENDKAQQEVLETLEQILSAALPKRGLLKFFSIPKPSAVQGLYLWGAVGRGKTMLMDLFYEHAPFKKKRRVHFHSFMLDVHTRIHNWRKANANAAESENPIVPVSKALAAEFDLLCLDELQVSDVADAMILSKLFLVLLDKGIFITFTCNRPPEALYQGGLQRERFLAFIDVIRARLKVMELQSDEDYRMKQIGALEKVYVTPHDAGAVRFLNDTFSLLAHHQPPYAYSIEVQGHHLGVEKAYGGVAYFTFNELCARPLGAADYLAIAEQFHTVMIEGIPVLSAEKRNEAKRFVTLIDTFYDHKVKLIATAAAPPEALYPEGDGAFEFQRTVSRLAEMQSEQYLSQAHQEAA